MLYPEGVLEYTDLASPPLALDAFEQDVLVSLGCLFVHPRLSLQRTEVQTRTKKRYINDGICSTSSTPSFQDVSKIYRVQVFNLPMPYTPLIENSFQKLARTTEGSHAPSSPIVNMDPGH